MTRRTSDQRVRAKLNRAAVIEQERAFKADGWRKVGGIFTAPGEEIWVGPGGQKMPRLPAVDVEP